MKELTAIRGTVQLEDSYCRIVVLYCADKEDQTWDIRFNSLSMDIINSNGVLTQRVDLKPWQMERAIEILEPQLEVEAFKDIEQQLALNKEQNNFCSY